jgi:replicative DNA helicase
MAAAQLSRAVEQRSDKEPQLSDLRESGSLEQDADIVMFIYREEKDPTMSNVTHLKVAKHRNGPVGQIDLIFKGNLTKFENAATRNYNVSGL